MVREKGKNRLDKVRRRIAALLVLAPQGMSLSEMSFIMGEEKRTLAAAIAAMCRNGTVDGFINSEDGDGSKIYHLQRYG